MGEVVERAVVITGASKGLGRELALAFSAAGAYVVGTYVSDHAAADSLRRELKSSRAGGDIVCHDVRQPSFPVTAVPVAKELVLINNAAIPFAPRALHTLAWDEFQNHLDVVVKGAFLTVTALLRPLVAAERGTIVNVLTAAIGDSTPKGFGGYLVAKYALLGLTQALAADYGPRGLRVFGVSPGYMETALTSGWADSIKTAAAGGAAQKPAEVATWVAALIANPAVAGKGETHVFGGH